MHAGIGVCCPALPIVSAMLFKRLALGRNFVLPRHAHYGWRSLLYELLQEWRWRSPVGCGQQASGSFDRCAEYAIAGVGDKAAHDHGIAAAHPPSMRMTLIGSRLLPVQRRRYRAGVAMVPFRRWRRVSPQRRRRRYRSQQYRRDGRSAGRDHHMGTLRYWILVCMPPRDSSELAVPAIASISGVDPLHHQNCWQLLGGTANRSIAGTAPLIRPRASSLRSSGRDMAALSVAERDQDTLRSQRRLAVL